MFASLVHLYKFEMGEYHFQGQIQRGPVPLPFWIIGQKKNNNNRFAAIMSIILAGSFPVPLVCH